MTDPAADPVLSACAAAANACIGHLNAAADAWAETPDTVPSLLRSAELARDRIDAHVRDLLTLLPSHARKSRRAAEVAERATSALHAVRALPSVCAVPDDPDDAEDLEEREREAVEAATRAIGSLRRAADALGQ